MNPLVSVMMPAKNTEKYIAEAIKSIINQTYTNWELIIVDDKSTDKTREIAESFAKTDNRIKVFNGDGLGVAHTRNQIIDLSQGKYIMLQDSDDICDKQRVHLLLEVAEKHEKCFIGSNLHFTDNNLNIKKTSNRPTENYEIRRRFKKIFNRNAITPGTSLAHRELYVQNRYNEFYQILSDWDLVLRISEDYNVVFANVKEPIYSYRLNNGSMTLDQQCRIKYNLLLRYNEICRHHNKKEIKSLKIFEKTINNNLLFKLIYIISLSIKRKQHEIVFNKKFGNK